MCPRRRVRTTLANSNAGASFPQRATCDVTRDVDVVAGVVVTPGTTTRFMVFGVCSRCDVHAPPPCAGW